MNSAGGFSPPKAQARPSKPFAPVRLPQYASSGTQKMASVNSTEYVRQAAELLIAPDGKLDTTHIPQMIADLKRDTTLSSDHRNQLIKTLQKLQQGGPLAATIDGTCERKPLRGPAADLVRATLNLPPQQTTLTAADARKAMLMTVLGHLRQGTVGSCFATGPAISAHKDSEIVATQLKELLEENCLTFKQGKSTVQVPLNKRISRAEAQIKLTVTADGTCFGKVNGAASQPYQLHQTPGMQGALTALGIPADKHGEAVSTALRQMGCPNGTKYQLSCQEIIEHIAHNAPGNTPPTQRFASAINAFAGKEDVRLLRAWEYTLATHSETNRSGAALNKMTSAVLHGASIHGAPHLCSLSTVGKSTAHQLRQHPDYRGVPVDNINHALMNNVEKLMKKRFFMQYDADVEQSGVSHDGVSNRGGFVLCNRTPPNAPSQWQHLDTPEKFQRAMVDLVEEASRITAGQTGRMRGNPQLKQNTLRFLTDNIKQHVGTPAFTEHAKLRFNSPNSEPPTADPHNLPWKQGRGGWFGDLVNELGGEMLHQAQFSPQLRPMNNPGGAPSATMDASHIMRFLADGVNKMRPQLQAKANATPGDFQVPLGNSIHAFSFLPMAMADVWSDRATVDQWMNTKLVQPALQHVQARRTEPALFKMMNDLGKELNMHPNEVSNLYQRIAQRNGGLRHGPQGYTLAGVHEELKAHFLRQPNGDALLERAEQSILRSAPTPATLFADTNWGDDKGNAVYMGASYNPFRSRVESHFMDAAGGGKRPMGEEWLTGGWFLSPPLGSKARAV